jgi:uncharacterized protein YcbK (DUF882 family)
MKIFHVLKHFRRSEFTNPDAMSQELLWKLDYARELAGLPFHITSSYRAKDPRFHGEGKAVDIACSKSHERFIIVTALLFAGFTRIGIYENHIHADTGTAPIRVLWWGTYKEKNS